MTNFVPPPMEVDKRSGKRARMELEEDPAAEPAEENCNLICPPNYPPFVADTLRQLPEKEVPFGLIGALLE